MNFQNRKYIFVKGKLDIIDYFIEELLQGAVENAQDYFVLDLKELKSQSLDLQTFINSGNSIPTVLITFNNIGIELLIEDGKNLWEVMGIRIYNIYVDHPVNYHNYLHRPLKDMTIITVDRDHKKYIEEYYPQVHRVVFIPLGGKMDKRIIPYRERSIDVLYVGGCQPEIKEIPQDEDIGMNLSEFCNQVIAKMINTPELTSEEAVRLYVREKNMREVETEQFLKMMSYMRLVTQIVRRFYKYKIMGALADTGIRVHIYGENWEGVSCKYPENLILHGNCSMEEGLAKIADSKVVLNCMAWFKDGSSERVHNIMLNQAVCVTDPSFYLTEHFTHGKELVYYSLRDVEGMTQDVKFLLDHPAYAEKIAAAGCRAAYNYTWTRMMEHMMELED